MKYGPRRYSIRPRGIITRYCKKCQHHVCITKYTVPQKPITKTQKVCDYCLGVKVWEDTATH